MGKAAGLAVLALLVNAAICVAENYIVTGDMSSKLHYEIQQRISPDPGISRMKFSCVIPKSSQSITFAQEISDSVCFLHAGRIHEQGPPTQIFGAPREQRTKDFLQRVLDAGRM